MLSGSVTDIVGVGGSVTDNHLTSVVVLLVSQSCTVMSRLFLKIHPLSILW